MIGIYKITSPTGRIYVGQSLNIKRRFNQYKNLNCIRQKRLLASMLKYGFNAHKFEVIIECPFDSLYEMERFYQEKYCVTGRNGLNCQLTNTSEKKRVVSESTKNKIRKATLGRKHTDAAKQNMKIAQKGISCPMHAREKIKQTHKKKGVQPTKNAVELSIIKNSKLVFDTLTGVYYSSIKELSDLIGSPYPTLKGKLNNSRLKNNTKYILA